MKYEGSCHCGGIAFTAEGEIEQVIDCNCSMCRRRGGLLWFVPATSFQLATQPEQMRTYLFNSRHIEHHFCPVCGISPYSEATDKEGARMMAVNVRCLPEVDLGALTVVQVDGASM